VCEREATRCLLLWLVLCLPGKNTHC
jgi:hypothetical protein